MLIFPGGEEELLQTLPEAVDLAWPGLRLVDGEIAVLPAAGRGQHRGIQPGSPWEETPGTLTAAEASMAIGELLNMGCLTDTSVAVDSLKRKREKFIKNPRDMKRQKPERTWPATATSVAAAAAAAKKGRENYEKGERKYCYVGGWNRIIERKKTGKIRGKN